jgi:hypothetical protein
MKELDYLIAEVKGGKPFLAQVKEIDDKTLVVIPDHQRYVEERTIEITKRDILVRLGANPKPGKVYGVDVANVYRKSIAHDFWGVIHFFVKPEKEVLQRLKIGLDHTANKLDKMGFREYTTRFQTEIRAKKGKYAGMYQHRPDNKSLVWYAPEMSEDQKTMNYIIFHEFGHVLRFNGLKSVKTRARWQRLFQQSIAPIVVSRKWLDGLQAHIKDSAEAEASLGSIIKEYQKDEDETDAYLKALSRWFKQVHHISPRDLQVLWEANDLETITSLWPTSSIDTSKLSPLITEYATKNVEETFAESFAFYMMDMKLPGHVEKLLEKSLSIIKDAA